MGKIMQGDYVGMSWGRLFEEACEILYASMFLCDPLHNFDNIIPFCVLDPGSLSPVPLSRHCSTAVTSSFSGSKC